MRVDEDVRQLIEDLRACHEYYCRYNCGTLRVAGQHTMRCQRLRETYDFPAYPKAADPQDVK